MTEEELAIASSTPSEPPPIDLPGSLRKEAFRAGQSFVIREEDCHLFAHFV